MSGSQRKLLDRSGRHDRFLAWRAAPYNHLSALSHRRAILVQVGVTRGNGVQQTLSYKCASQAASHEGMKGR
jgi:hypothetical protein